jgi:hypothetical protein
MAFVTMSAPMKPGQITLAMRRYKAGACRLTLNIPLSEAKRMWKDGIDKGQRFIFQVGTGDDRGIVALIPSKAEGVKVTIGRGQCHMFTFNAHAPICTKENWKVGDLPVVLIKDGGIMFKLPTEQYA